MQGKAPSQTSYPKICNVLARYSDLPDFVARDLLRLSVVLHGAVSIRYYQTLRTYLVIT